MHVIPA